MVQVLTMPMMGNTMEIGLVVEWAVSEGESITEDETVVVVESEKAANEIVAEQSGVLVSIDVPEGEEVPPGTQLGVIRGHDEDDSDVETTGESERATPESPTDSEETVSEVPSATEQSSEPSAADGERVPAAPGARRMAREESVSLEAVEGTGPGGAVLIQDMEAVLEDETREESTVDAELESDDSHVIAPPRVRRIAREYGISLSSVAAEVGSQRISESDVKRVATADTKPSGEPTQTQQASEAISPETYGLTVSERRQFTGIRRTIARRMSQSATEKPHVTINRTTDAERLLSVVEEYRDNEAGPGLTDILVCAVTEALQEHPKVNAWYDGEELSLIEEINVGVAVDIEDGLVTPVLRNTQDKTPADLTRERAALTTKVQEGQFTPDDIQGGTFTITNLGMFGVDSFDPIINPPEIAILGVGRIRDSSNGRVLTLSLSFDHRVVDGADAARFLDSIVDGLSAPTKLLTRRVTAALE